LAAALRDISYVFFNGEGPEGSESFHPSLRLHITDRPLRKGGIKDKAITFIKNTLEKEQ
jgi:hypothetical protein